MSPNNNIFETIGIPLLYRIYLTFPLMNRLIRRKVVKNHFTLIVHLKDVSTKRCLKNALIMQTHDKFFLNNYIMNYIIETVN